MSVATIRLSDLRNGSDGDKGLTCRKCGCKHFRVIYTREHYESSMRRRRECRHCGYRITTLEKPL